MKTWVKYVLVGLIIGVVISVVTSLYDLFNAFSMTNNPLSDLLKVNFGNLGTILFFRPLLIIVISIVLTVLILFLLRTLIKLISLLYRKAAGLKFGEAWLKGGLIASVIGLILGVLLSISMMSGGLFFGFGGGGGAFSLFALIYITLPVIAIFFIIGALIGLAIGKARRKQE